MLVQKRCTKQDVCCFGKLLGPSNGKCSPPCPLFSGTCSFGLGGGLGSVLSCPNTTALAGALTVPWRCPTDCDVGFHKDAARPWAKAQKCWSESFQGCWDAKCSGVSSTTTKRVLVSYSPGFLLDVYQLHPSFPPAISTYSVAKGDETHSPPSSFRNLSHLPHWVGTRAVG